VRLLDTNRLVYLLVSLTSHADSNMNDTVWYCFLMKVVDMTSRWQCIV